MWQHSKSVFCFSKYPHFNRAYVLRVCSNLGSTVNCKIQFCLIAAGKKALPMPKSDGFLMYVLTIYLLYFTYVQKNIYHSLFQYCIYLYKGKLEYFCNASSYIKLNLAFECKTFCYSERKYY